MSLILVAERLSLFLFSLYRLVFDLSKLLGESITLWDRLVLAFGLERFSMDS
jgi:hypothetical protein